MDSSESVATTEPFPQLAPPMPPAAAAETSSNEQFSTPVENSRFEKLKSATATIFEKAGVKFKKGPGRPRSDGKPGKADLPLNAPATALPANAAPATASDTPHFDSVLVRRCCSAVVKGFTGVMDKLLYRRALKAGDKPAEAQQLVADTSITKEELDSFSELAEICLRKYGVDTSYVPEIGLVVLVAGIGTRYAVAMAAKAPPEKPDKAESIAIENLNGAP